MVKNWTDQEEPDKFAWRSVLGVIAILVVCGGIGAGVWAVKVATSQARGAGDQTRIVNDARNRINAQEWFQGQHAQIIAADAKLDDAYTNMQGALGTPDEAFFRTNYTGLRNRCIEMRETYNAETQKVTRAKWRDESLPFHLDDGDARTDCAPKASPSAAAR